MKDIGNICEWCNRPKRGIGRSLCYKCHKKNERDLKKQEEKERKQAYRKMIDAHKKTTIKRD